MTKTYPHTKSAEQALIDYGFEFDYSTNFYRKKSMKGWADTQMWQPSPLKDGWICVELARPSTNPDGTEGKPWGTPYHPLPGYYQIPFSQEYHNASGETHPSKDHGLFEWIWPEDYVAFLYEHGLESIQNGNNNYQSIEDANGNVTLVPFNGD